jgi:hypothetical protein
MVTPPTMTKRIAMTIATMGRLMKNFDMAFDSFALWKSQSALTRHCS